MRSQPNCGTMNIVLVGFMGTGKTVVAQKLSEKLGRRYVCLDDMIEEKEGKAIVRIFEENGESYFRKVEKEVTMKASKLKDVIIDAGGGVVKDNGNVKNLKGNGIMVCLSATPEVIYERIKHEPHRPLLNVSNPKERIQKLLNQRAHFYAKADYTIDTSELTIDEVVNEIIDLAKAKK